MKNFTLTNEGQGPDRAEIHIWYGKAARPEGTILYSPTPERVEEAMNDLLKRWPTATHCEVEYLSSHKVTYKITNREETIHGAQ